MNIGWDDDFDVLPDTTADERHEGRGGEDDETNDERLVEERPPHWD